MRAHINLAAQEVLYEVKPFPLEQVVVPMAVAGIVVLLALVTVGYAWRVTALKKDVRQLTVQRDKTQQELARLNGEVSNLADQTGAGRETATDQLAAMKSLLEHRIPWSDVIREITFLVPDGVWLTQIDSTDPKANALLPGPTGKTIHFVGVAQSQAAVNRFIAALERSPRYEAVSLIFSQKGGGEGVQGVGFELTAGLR